MWVEPETGIIIVGQQQGKQELRTAGEDAGSGTIVFDGTLRFNDTTINDNVTKAKDNMSKLSLLTSWPIAMWVIGAILFVVGAVMLVLGNRRGGRYGSDAPLRRQPAAAR